MSKTASRVDLDALATVPSVDVSTTITLIKDLSGRAPKGISAAFARDVRAMRTAGHDLEVADRAVMRERATDERKEKSATRVAADQRLDRAWSGVEGRLVEWPKVDDTFAEQKQSAAQLYELLFATGLEFVNAPQRAQWAESEQRLKLLKEQDLEAALRAAVGDAFVTTLFDAHAAYGKALGVGDAAATVVSETTLEDPLNEARYAVRKYARQVIALVNERDPASVDEAVARLEPLEEARRTAAEAAARKKATEAKNEEPAKPE